MAAFRHLGNRRTSNSLPDHYPCLGNPGLGVHRGDPNARNCKIIIGKETSTMTNATFLKNFERHVRFFLRKKAITKKMILQNLKNCECPFMVNVAIDFRKWGPSRYLGKCGNKIVHRWDAEISFERNMEFNWRTMVNEMIKVVNKKVKP